MDWHFWGTGHGKGPHDGAGACLKQSIRKEQLRRDSRKLHGAADVVNYLKTDESSKWSLSNCKAGSGPALHVDWEDGSMPKIVDGMCNDQRKSQHALYSECRPTKQHTVAGSGFFMFLQFLSLQRRSLLL